ncbi:MAG: hypothetical protein KAG20_00520 [Cocleimonas sp.]|nr:hypothetical protein [Cocleimonas sp.]
MKRTIKNSLLSCLFLLSLASCSQQESTVFTGDYRYYAGISEFFDCKTKVKYYLGKQGIKKALEEKYLALTLNEKEDVYLNVEGYLIQESATESLIPATIFVATKFIRFDTSRGCEIGSRQGY